MTRVSFEEPDGFAKGDRVRIIAGSFKGFEGVVAAAGDSEQLVTVELKIFGRPVAIQVEYWWLERTGSNG